MNEEKVLFPNYQTYEFQLEDGRSITLETGKVAKQADGAIMLSMGNTRMLATVVSTQEPREGISFFPLSVDYQEKFASSGKIPGGFLKREGRLSEYEILTSRLVDRALRPLFADNYRNDTQVMITLHSYDKNIMPDALACFAASAALIVSDIPFNGPISEARVIRVNGEYKINPSKEEMALADIELMVAATLESVVMVEGEMDEVSEEEMVEAIQFAHEAIKLQCEAQLKLAKLVGATSKREVEPLAENEELKAMVETVAKAQIEKIANGALPKHERSEQLKAIKVSLIESLGEEPDEEEVAFVSRYYKELEKQVIRDMMLNKRIRLDGRKPDEVRPIDCEIDILPSAHGSALFTRGETQSISTCTLGTKLDEQMIDGATGKWFTDFILHYNFPGFSTGEVRPNRGAGRREIGHGNLALRSLKRVLPDAEDNPYTIRIISDILESNGSSSMATVCAGSLALMDTGVKIKAPVSGIAMGLISGDDGKVVVLSDILGDEDHLGDMDFKVTGTEKGICACQMDIKIEGLSYDILKEALEQAKAGRLHILSKMTEVIDKPRDEYKPHVPQIVKMFISNEFIGAIIGPGGKVIQEMQKETNTVIMIEEVGNQGEIIISGEGKESIDAAVSRIKAITAIPQTGEVYESTVKTIMPYGAFVEFMPGKEGLLHISEISWQRLENMDNVFEVGDKVKVKLLDIDKRSGKFKLSRKVLLEKPNFENKKGGE
jgi:polyribonucleotide nucleotidyltransferase